MIARDSEDDALSRAVGAFIAAHSGARAVEVTALARLGGGAIQENYALDVHCDSGTLAGRHALVLRTDAPATLPLSLDRAQEFEVLRAAYAAGVMVPEPLLCCTDTSVIGRTFFIMRRVPGVAVARRLLKAADAGDIDDTLVERLGAELAHLHRLRPPLPALEALGAPPGDCARVQIDCYRELLDELPTPQPLLEWALAWLEEHAPTRTRVVLCHNDYRTGNVLVERGELRAILDWEFAGWGEPMQDLGWFCARCWRFGAWQREAGGLGSRAAFYAGYASAADTPVDDRAVRYWEIMAAARWALIALHQVERHLSGVQPSLELALTGRMVPEMGLDILLGIEQYERHG